MQCYADLNDDSGVSSYEIGAEYIKVWFNRDTASYIYSYLWPWLGPSLIAQIVQIFLVRFLTHCEGIIDTDARKLANCVIASTASAQLSFIDAFWYF